MLSIIGITGIALTILQGIQIPKEKLLGFKLYVGFNLILLVFLLLISPLLDVCVFAVYSDRTTFALRSRQDYVIRSVKLGLIIVAFAIAVCMRHWREFRTKNFTRDSKKDELRHPFVGVADHSG